jgi:hypothetical protein
LETRPYMNLNLWPTSRSRSPFEARYSKPF